MAAREHNPFSVATALRKLNSHEYAGDLKDDWCIGTVPNGGYSLSVVMAAAKLHMETTHGKISPPQHDFVTVQANFTVKVQKGPTIVKVTDTKIGRSYSVLHLALTQDGMNCIVAYITMGNIATESGPTFTSPSNPPPPPILGRSNLEPLKTKKLPGWKELEMPFAEFRRAATNMRFFSQQNPVNERGLEQYEVFADGENFTNTSLGFVSDMFIGNPASMAEFEKAKESGEKPSAAYWYPTLTLNIEFKVPLPKEGVPWLFSRVNAKQVANGRMDMEVIVFDIDGNLIAISTHVALMVDASRNTKARGKRVEKL